MNFLLQTTLRKDTEFIPANDALQAMYYLKKKKKVDTLIVDVDFQTEQNWELIQHIKTSRLYDLPVLVLTSQNDESVHEKCLQYGIDDIFFKPFNPEDLRLVVMNTITTSI